MLTESQIVFAYVQEHPEVAEGIFREEVRKAIQKEAAEHFDRADVEALPLIRQEVKRMAKELAEKAFYMNFELTEEPLVKTVKRDCTERVLELRMALINAMNGLNSKMNRLEFEVEGYLGRPDRFNDDDDEPDEPWG